MSKHGFAQSTADMQARRAVAHLVVLKKGDRPARWPRRATRRRPNRAKADAKDKKRRHEEGRSKKDVEVVIDFDGIDQRIVAADSAGDLPQSAGGRGRSNLLPAKSPATPRRRPARRHALTAST